MIHTKCMCVYVCMYYMYFEYHIQRYRAEPWMKNIYLQVYRDVTSASMFDPHSEAAER